MKFHGEQFANPLELLKEFTSSDAICAIRVLEVAPYFTRPQRGGKRGRGAPGKTPFVAAVQTNEEDHPIAMCFTQLQGFRKEAITQWVQRHLTAGSLVVSDGLNCFSGVVETGYRRGIVTGGGPASVTLEAFTWVNTLIGNVKNSMHGSYYAISHRHLPRYLTEFCYRFNRRFKLEEMIPRLGYAAVRTPLMSQ